MRKAIRICDSVLLLIVTAIFVFVTYGSFALPNKINISDSSKTSFCSDLFSVDVPAFKTVSSTSDTSVSNLEREVKLLGIIPVKNISISNSKKNKVIVSGEAFGIKIFTNGVMVVGTKNINVGKKEVNPASNAGIKAGDIIVSINNQNTYSSEEVEEMLTDNSGKSYKIVIERNNRYKTFTLKPVYSSSDGCYKAGIWVRDSTAGIGTITFFNPNKHTLAALGHPITDVDTEEIMPILKGEAVKAQVTKIYKSRSGFTGSICCDFLNTSIGTLNENTVSGIYGTYNCKIPTKNIYEVADIRQVEKGDCQILTTVTNGKPKLYSAKITYISYHGGNEQKNMIIKITDKNLIAITGGIVQGMSGSPIIQNGRLVGALTHVIVDNPKKGYAIFAESMLTESKNVK